MSPVLSVLFILFMIIAFKPTWQSVIRLAADRSQTYQIILFLVSFLVPLAFLFVIFVLLLFIMNKYKNVKTIYTDKTIFAGSEVQIRIEDDAIISESGQFRSEVNWSEIQRINKTRGHIIIFVSQHRNLIIPKRAFERPSDFDVFWSVAKSKVAAASKAG